MRRYIVAFIVTFFMGLLPVFANIVPVSINDIPTNSIGVYQADSTLTVYKLPKRDSSVLKEIRIVNAEFRESEYDNIFAVLIPSKNLGYLYVTDVDDEWVEVIYNKKKMLKGWVYKNDDFQFLPWINFYNMYGRKYGLKYLKDVPDGIFDIHTQTDVSSKVVGQTLKPREMRLTSIEGNWMLVSVLDSSYSINTGYIIWRTLTGVMYLFPNIK